MHLRPLTNGKVSSTGTITDLKQCSSFVVLANTDGTNAATIVVRKEDASGGILLDYSGIQAGCVTYSPIVVDGASQLYYSVTGTGASAQVFGYVA